MKKVFGILTIGLMATGIAMAAPDKGKACCASKDKKEASCSAKTTASTDKKESKDVNVAAPDKAGCCSKDAKHATAEPKKETKPVKKA